MKKCHKADHAEIVELRDAYAEAAIERARLRVEVGNLRPTLEVEASRRVAAEHAVDAVREFAWGLGASTASRADILDALTRQPFAPSGPGTLAPTESLDHWVVERRECGTCHAKDPS